MSDEEKQRQDVIEQSNKEVAYYTQLVSAWFRSRMELDKSLLALSSTGLGLLVTLMTTASELGALEKLFSALGCLSFLATILFVLMNYHFNGNYLEGVVKGGDYSKEEDILRNVDCLRNLAFGAGLLSLTFFGVFMAV